MRRRPKDDSYEYYCVDCGATVNHQDKTCANCGADITEFVEEGPEADQGAQDKTPTCPLCGSHSFDKEEGRLDSKWGFTSHKVILLICNRCQFVLHFYDGHSIFDFD